MLASVVVSLPPLIGGEQVDLGSAVVAVSERAAAAIAALDATHGDHLRPLAALLLRSESVASSKIERIEASVDDFARALHGSRANASASSMVASTRALGALVNSADAGSDIDLESILEAHRLLMLDDPVEAPYAGRLRDMQNWIGGSDHSPRGALYVPPPPETVADYLADLLVFANRSDVPVLAQAAIAHAQFESIYPFTDGNGRIGRALVNTILRRRGVTSTVMVPLASALVAHRDGYFSVLTDYRSGRAEPVITAFAEAAEIAASEARVTASLLAELPEQWRETLGSVRRGSAVARLVERLAEEPVISAEEAQERLGGASSSVYAAIARLHEAGILRPLTRRTRDQVWGVSDLLAELEDLGKRIEARARSAEEAATRVR